MQFYQFYTEFKPVLCQTCFNLVYENLSDKTRCNRPKPALNPDKSGSFTSFTPSLIVILCLVITVQSLFYKTEGL
jgi:hypothetical protein